MKKHENVIGRVYAYFLKEGWNRHKLYFVVRAGKMIIQSATPFLTIYFIPAIIGELMGNKNPNRLIGLAASLVLLEFVFAILTTIAKEVKAHIIFEKKGAPYRPFNDCKIRAGCSHKGNVCQDCTRGKSRNLCFSCGKCTTSCKDYIKEVYSA